MSKITLEIMLEVKKANTLEQIKQCYQVMRQLRPHLLEEERFVEQVHRQTKEGYQLIYLEENSQVKAIAGYRFLEFLAWGKVLYIDDLITDSDARGSGYGSKLMKWLTEEAENKKCDQLHLDSGSQRYDAHRLYMKHRMQIIGHHFALDLRKHC